MAKGTWPTRGAGDQLKNLTGYGKQQPQQIHQTSLGYWDEIRHWMKLLYDSEFRIERLFIFLDRKYVRFASRSALYVAFRVGSLFCEEMTRLRIEVSTESFNSAVKAK